MKYSYFPTGVCSRQINLELDDNGKITSCEFVGGCSGNTQGICMLVKGMDAKDAVDRLKGIDCRGRGTSCPDQISKALVEVQSKKLFRKEVIHHCETFFNIVACLFSLFFTEFAYAAVNFVFAVIDKIRNGI